MKRNPGIRPAGLFRVPGLAAVLVLALLLGGCMADGGDGSEERQGAGAPSSASSPPAASPARSASPSLPSAEPGNPGKGPACPTENCFSLMLAGDLLVHPQLWEQAAVDAAATGKGPLDFEPLLAGQRTYISGSDLAVCHMETPVAEPDGPYTGYPMFNVPPQILTAAAAVGYSGCTTASNHAIDAGTAGLNRTLGVLDSLGLAHTGSYAAETGAGAPMLLSAPAGDLAVIEATYGLNGLVAEYPWQVDLIDAPAMIDKARTARAEGADVVVAAIHAGEEYASVPNAQQVETAHALADSGEFDFIYGHHTHSVLPIENYNGTWIVYGLGNAVTELSPSYDVNNEGLIVRAQFARDDAGAWTVSDLAWAPSVIVRDPYRWCSVAGDLPQGECAPPAQREAVRARTVPVVESLGAADAGAHEWLMTQDGGGG
ncbi:CapA family protein [Arthrobacter sp. zg-Y1110]|uniref:CapA family protein n=1 Tax=Arthrobacter sp. zg-Y1110 TaxID=2886932 RepID=UPI001D15E398|nr:CapA family protein [Arthrobacter sp. zg-Y1110]MCC3291345.1 CapA family protein [Arthrobacter sp. zg-Y1110]UWX83764.1 CapA family protein [Arthrobacter sp. zg-Y1110]